MGCYATSMKDLAKEKNIWNLPKNISTYLKENIRKDLMMRCIDSLSYGIPKHLFIITLSKQ
jgi:hypothetical protein